MYLSLCYVYTMVLTLKHVYIEVMGEFCWIIRFLYFSYLAQTLKYFDDNEKSGSNASDVNIA